MAIVPLAWLSSATPGVDLAVDSDMQARHPRIVKDLWAGSTSYSVQLQLAFGQVLGDLVSRGYVAAQIPNSTINRTWAKEAVIRKTFAMVFLDFITEKDDKWDRLRAEYLRDYQVWLDGVQLEYDKNNDGTIDDDDEAVTAPITLVR